MGTGVIYRGSKMLKEHRFRTSCERLSGEVLLTRNLALTYQIDIDLVLEQKGSKVYLLRKTDFIPEGLKGVFNGVVFAGIAFKEKDGAEEFHFYGNGWVDGEEKVVFFVPKDSKKQYNLWVKRVSL